VLTVPTDATPTPGIPTQPDRAAAQRAADRELFAQLQEGGFTGPRFELLRERLWIYGWNVLRSWMRKGTIIQKCRERHIWFAAPYTEVEELMRRADVREDLAIDCLDTAITDFLAEGGALEGWNPDKGRNLTSYFMHFALRHFRDAYRRWAREHRRRLFDVLGEDTFQRYRFEQGTVVWGPFPFPGPEHQAVLREALAVILDGASREEYAVCKAMLITGATQEEIAQLLGTTRKSVERRLARVRGRANKLAAAGVIMTPSVSSAVTR
jgi:RNA polymerase sigma factor (sigma-70 family)